MTEQPEIIIGAMKTALHDLRHSGGSSDYVSGIKYGVCLGYAAAFEYDVMKRLHTLAKNAADYARKDWKESQKKAAA
jgi:hypothetical protein